MFSFLIAVKIFNLHKCITGLSTDYSPLISLSNDNSDNKDHGLSKFNSSLVHDELFVENMEKLIAQINTSDEMGMPKQNANF